MESLLLSSSTSSSSLSTTSPIFSSSKHALIPKPQNLSFNSTARLALLTCNAHQMNSPPSTVTAAKEVKLWGGRFEESVTDAVEKFTESISFDKALYKQNIMGCKAHASMLAKQGLMSDSDRDTIIKGLEEIERQIEAGQFLWRTDREDVHTNVEAALTDLVGEPAKKLHTAGIALVELALQNEVLIVPGYTHLQRAQPLRLSLRILDLHIADNQLDCRARVNFCPLGACALAGTGLPIDRFMTSDALGFTVPMRNSIDAVSDRDFVLELLSANSITAVHPSRLGEEWVLWASEEFGFLTPSDSVSTGSSIMPQKKNPEWSLFEDKEPIFDSVKAIVGMLEVSAEFAQNVSFNRERIQKALPAGHLDATTLADYLVKTGIPFRTSHDIVGRSVALCVSKNCELQYLSLDESYGSTDSEFVAGQLDYWIDKLSISKGS
ncbi:unnamed protein product [Withania somnifera]